VMPGQAHEIVIRTKMSGQADAMVARLGADQALADTEIAPWTVLVPELGSMLNMVDFAGYFILFFVFVAAIAGIANTLMMSTFERMHEFGMLLALGTRPGRLIRMIFLEAIFLGLLGVVVGTMFGYGFEGIFGHFGIDLASFSRGGEVKDIAFQGLNFPLDVKPRLELMDTVIGFAAVMVTSMLAAVWPAWVAGRLEPMEAMRK
jgi:putative ABC transport system permease protein